ncbi:imidazolonepropionase [Oleiagrimonas soli]|uniref:Imidazolonepropionase n=1 Tax=Oleiagrimonas soli TaxID=1543381 RepID=A0A099CV57_9GAMM|nr:imidazolonepropionase [Oleiagrimonas soli]KGI77674.1 imidazolonepropionase [Oleiagrimonas soli]MBB6182801.1 imidazolonepropionase [Oleiagrimonas soli]
MTDRPRFDLLLLHARIATLDPERDAGYGLIEDGALGCIDGRIAWIGRSDDVSPQTREQAARVVDAEQHLLTPGLIDCHTHLVFGGDRADEFEMRLEGADYAAIARAGGGILSSVRATRAASEDDLLAQALPRARDLLADGVTTLEIKSGYGLDLQTERRMLRVARRIGDALGITVRTSFLGLHALPPECADDAEGYVAEVCDRMLPTLAGEGLIDAVDAFCETIGFTPAQVRRLFDQARTLGLPVKLHAEQLSDQGGAALTASFGGLSADHLEYLSEDGVRAMAEAGTVAVLLPGAFYALRETKLPPIESLRAHGVPMAVGSDLNPGTAPMRSLRLAGNMACTLFRLTPLEALRGMTVHAARALGLGDRGLLAVGKRADLAMWNARHPAELSYWIGGRLNHRSYVAGRPV